MHDFDSVALQYLDAAYNLARWLTHDPTDAEDVVQEAYMRAFRSFESYRGGDSRAWMLKIVRNTCYSWLEKNRAKEVSYELDDDTPSNDAGPETELIATMDREQLMAMLYQLPTPFREAVILRDLEGLSYKEIAAVTDASIGTVMSRISRTRAASGGRENYRGCKMNCQDYRQLIDAYADGELDPANHLDVERHFKECMGCRRIHEGVLSLKGAISEGSLYFSAPAGFENKLRAAVPSMKPERSPWMPKFAWAGLAFAALLTVVVVGIVFFQTTRSNDDLLAKEIVSSHVRSMMANHLTDVASTDKHTVKPWFEGKLDYAPVVTDLAADGFPLIGGRLDYVFGRPVAALVYQRNQHVINLFVFPDQDRGEPGRKLLLTQGYNVFRWQAGGMTFWAVSDLNASELQEFVDKIRTSG